MRSGLFRGDSGTGILANLYEAALPHQGTAIIELNSGSEKGVFGKRGLFRKVHFIEIIDILENPRLWKVKERSSRDSSRAFRDYTSGTPFREDPCFRSRNEKRRRLPLNVAGVFGATTPGPPSVGVAARFKSASRARTAMSQAGIMMMLGRHVGRTKLPLKNF